MTLSPWALEELKWWQKEMQESNGKSVIPAKHQYILPQMPLTGAGMIGEKESGIDLAGQTKQEASSRRERAEAVDSEGSSRPLLCHQIPQLR